MDDHPGAIRSGQQLLIESGRHRRAPSSHVQTVSAFTWACLYDASLCDSSMLSVMQGIDRTLPSGFLTTGIDALASFWHIFLPLSLPGVGRPSLDLHPVHGTSSSHLPSWEAQRTPCIAMSIQTTGGGTDQLGFRQCFECSPSRRCSPFFSLFTTGSSDWTSSGAGR